MQNILYLSPAHITPQSPSHQTHKKEPVALETTLVGSLESWMELSDGC